MIPSLVVGGRVDAWGALASPGGRAVARDVLDSQASITPSFNTFNTS